MRQRQILLILFVLFAVPASAPGVEIKGTVVSVTGTTVKIKIESSFVPNAGDKVEISDEVPGLGQVPLSGTWKVTGVVNGLVTAVAEDASPGSPQVGYKATIFSDEPSQGTARTIDVGDIPELEDIPKWGYLGVQAQNNPDAPGVVIVGVVSGAPAEQAGLKKGDIIVEISNIRISNLSFFLRLVSAINPGTTITVTIHRNGQAFAKGATLTAMDRVTQFIRLGYAHFYGKGVEKDLAEAAKWYHLAAQLGHGDAQRTLGWMYQNGYGVRQDAEQAIEWYEKSAENANPVAQNSLGWIYEHGQGVGKDRKKAFLWYQKSAESGNTDGQNNLGRMYENGWGVKKDHAQARQWFSKAVEQNNLWGLFNLGKVYYNGKGLDKDPVKAYQYYREAADRGHAPSQDVIGFMYQKGKVVGKDHKEAFKWYTRAAEQGFANAQNNLGVMYHNGWGVDRDKAEAIRWYLLAAKQGNKYAKDNLRKLTGKDRKYSRNYRRKIGVEGTKYAEDALRRLIVK